MPDAELLRRHAGGDTEAFGEVVRRHRDRLWAVALRTLGDREEAADALQDALVSALRASAAGGFRGDSAVTTWLHRIVVNACLDLIRRRRGHLTVALPPEGGGEPVHAGTSRPEPVEQRELQLLILEALRALPPDQAAAIVLVDLEGWSVEEAARVLDVAPGTVKSRCSRGRVRLLPLLADLRPGPGSGAGNPERARDVPSGIEPALDRPEQHEQPGRSLP